MRDTVCHAEFCPHQEWFTVKSLEINGWRQKCHPENWSACFHAGSNIQKRTLSVFEVGKNGEGEEKHIIIAKVW